MHEMQRQYPLSSCLTSCGLAWPGLAGWRGRPAGNPHAPLEAVGAQRVGAAGQVAPLAPVEDARHAGANRQNNCRGGRRGEGRARSPTAGWNVGVHAAGRPGSPRQPLFQRGPQKNGRRKAAAGPPAMAMPAAAPVLKPLLPSSLSLLVSLGAGAGSGDLSGAGDSSSPGDWGGSGEAAQAQAGRQRRGQQ